MDHRVEIVLLEHAAKRSFIARIHLFERHFYARDLPHALDGLHLRIGEIIDNHDVVSGADEFYGRMGTDISGAATDQYALFFHGLNGLMFAQR